MSVYFTSLTTGWVVGHPGTILKTTNGGVDWIPQKSGTRRALFSIYFVSSSTGWIVGQYGTILKTTDGGVTFVGEDNKSVMPEKYILSQNYPNPFNPATVINYSIPVTGNVKIDVFDLLGRKIKTIVNEEKSAGTYIVKFDASFLSSGVYFYRLQVGNFVSTKKMVIMK
jgi:hypothetical protein